MRILFVTPTYPPMPGGGERYAAALAAQLRERGHDVRVVTSGATVESQLWHGAAGEPQAAADAIGRETVRRLPVRPFPGRRSGLMAYRKLMVVLSALPGDQSRLLSRMARRVPWIDGLEKALADEPEPDVVHAFNVSWECAMVAAFAQTRARRIPLVVTPYAHLGAGMGDRVARNSTMDHQLRILREAERVLVLTEVEREGLARYGVPADSIDVLGGSADPLPAGWEEACRELDNLHLPAEYALFVGRASRDKGALDAAEAVLRLRRQGRGAALVLVGSAAPEFTDWHARLGAEERGAIRPLGLVSETRKHALLERSSMLVLPSRGDSFGIVFLEAWQHAKPVIGARAGGIPGVITDQVDGLLVDYGDVSGLAAAMNRLLDDTALCRSLGEAGLHKVTHHFTWSETAARAEAAYRLVAGSS